MNSLISFVFYTLLIVVSSEENIFNSVESSLQFINNAQDKLKVTNESDIILVVGNTGSGKSTLVHYVAGDYSKLISMESPNPHNPDLVIKDELDRDNATISSTVSRTFVPKLVIDDEQYVWYDCPGFADTRNQTVEIANTIFIKRVIEGAKNIKIVMVVNYQSVTNGQNRNDFDDLLEQTTQLIKKIKHFENSFSLVVTKVPSTFTIKRKFIEISEEDVKNTTADFMFEHRRTLSKKGLFEDKIQLINSLLTQSEGIFPRISVFWKPDETGRFSEIQKFVVGRRLIRKSILENIVFAQIRSNDFGFPLSAEAQLYVRGMVEQAINSLFLQSKNLNDRVQNEIDQKIQSMHDFKRKLQIIHTSQSKIEYFEKIHAFSLKSFTGLFRELMTEISLQSIKEHELGQIERDGNTLNILESLVSEENLIDVRLSLGNNASQIIDYKSFLNKLSEFFQKYDANVQSDIAIEIPKIINNITVDMINVDQYLLIALKEKLKEMIGHHKKLNLLQIGKKSVETIGNAFTLEQRINQFSTLIQTLNLTSIDISACNRVKENSLYLNELKSLSKFDLIIPVGNWIINSSNAINFVSSEYVWYSFLLDVYNFLASYEVQKDVRAYNVRDISDWGKSECVQGLVITTTNFKQFTQRFNNLADFVPTPSKMNELNQIIRTTLKSTVKYCCDHQITMIEGYFVKSSDIQLTKCSIRFGKDMKKINVFVADTFYVDSDLNLNGIENVELHILANKWYILRPARFYLNGINGKSHAPPATRGTAGKPGNPGTNSGNFFGLANEITNGNLLTIELIGGNGGNGQDGTGNKDVKLVHGKDENNVEGYYPDWYCDLLTFESGTIKKTFTRVNRTCAHIKKETSSLIGRKVTREARIFPIHCCGVTGTGGAGGFGGAAGYSKFIHIANNGSGLPNVIKRNGINGILGRSARACKTTGLREYTNNKFIGIDNECNIWFEGNWSYESIDDYHCPNKYVYNTDAFLTPPPLFMTVTITEYENYLSEKMKNPTLRKIVQSTYDAIASNPNVRELA